MQPKMIAYDPLTGEIRGICLAPPQVMAWQAQGLNAIDGPDETNLDTHRVAEGQVVAKTVVELTPDKSEIIADGVDQAVVAVTVLGQDPPASLEIMVGNQSETVALAGGAGALSPVSALTPCTLQVAVADSITYRCDPVNIVAVEDVQL
ncbi:MAG: hypothetical protein KJ720_01785 [Proteobacteria bacterium]|nr:hypothetical protein [Pseudomonadota bacterium]MBU1451171.1 hypothetical protein [Pseudomonadota bacterium]MBU2469463.1 hypothetical protein [Pseudomonadota bacterium]